MKKATTLWCRTVSLLTLALMLVPMFLLTVFASESKDFNFTFGTTAATQRSSGYKDDVGDPSGYYAQANINSAYFNGGYIYMWVEDYYYDSVGIRDYATRARSVYLYYGDSDDVAEGLVDTVLSSNGTVRLVASVRTGSPGGCSGTWWP